MKKLIVFLTTVFIVLSFNACSNDNNDTNENNPDAIIGKWRVNQLLIKVDDQYEDDLLTECDKKSTINFFENGTYQLKVFEFNDDESICVAQEIINGTWENSDNNSYSISDFEIPEMTLSLEVKVTFESNKMILELSGTINFEDEEIDIWLKMIFIDNNDYVPDNIIGKWQLDQEFEDAIEVELTECEKSMTLELFEDGIYEEKDFYDEGSECIAVEIKKGTWKNLGDDMYEITGIDIPEVKVTFESDTTKMIVEFSETVDEVTHTQKLIFLKV